MAEKEKREETERGHASQDHLISLSFSLPNSSLLLLQMAPQWFPLENVPYDTMWADDRFWLPLLLAGAWERWERRKKRGVGRAREDEKAKKK